MCAVLKLKKNEFEMDVIPSYGERRTKTLKIEE
jgi:hypothetical protein